MVKLWYIYLYNRILLNDIKEGTTDTCWAKETRHRSTSCMIQVIWNSRKGETKLSNKKQNSGCLGLRIGRSWWESLTIKGTREFLGWWKCYISWLLWWLHGYIHLSKLIDRYTSYINLNYASIKLIFKKAFSCSRSPCQLFCKAPELATGLPHIFSLLSTPILFHHTWNCSIRTAMTSMLLDPMVSSHFSHLTWPVRTSHPVRHFFLEALFSCGSQDTAVSWSSFHLWSLFLSILPWFSWSSPPSTARSASACSLPVLTQMIWFHWISGL